MPGDITEVVGPFLQTSFSNNSYPDMYLVLLISFQLAAFLRSCVISGRPRANVLFSIAGIGALYLTSVHMHDVTLTNTIISLPLLILLYLAPELHVSAIISAIRHCLIQAPTFTQVLILLCITFSLHCCQCSSSHQPSPSGSYSELLIFFILNVNWRYSIPVNWIQTEDYSGDALLPNPSNVAEQIESKMWFEKMGFILFSCISTAKPPLTFVLAASEP